MALNKGCDGAVGLGGQAKGSSFTQKAMEDIEGFFLIVAKQNICSKIYH